MGFSVFNLDPRLLKATAEANYVMPTAIQKQAIAPCLEGHDLIGTAATGTGKTAAFVLPMLHRLLHPMHPPVSPRALVIAPTRELAGQIHDVIKALGRHTPLKSAVVYGGVGFEPQRRVLAGGTDIVVACPGRLLDLMRQGPVDLSRVGVLVLDEADRMLDMGFLPDITRIMAALPAERQTLLFSATFAPELMALIRKHLRQPRRVGIEADAPARTIAHCFYPVPVRLKTPLLLALLKNMEHRSILVFTRTKHRANRVMETLAKHGFPAGVLHANKSQNARTRALDGFRSGELGILVATDIAARGIDVSTISHVINYDIPDTATNYIHRIGRTGRAEQTGDAITFISPEDIAEVKEIERQLGHRVAQKTLAGFDYEQAGPGQGEFARPPQPPRRHGHAGPKPERHGGERHAFPRHRPR